MFSHDLEQTIEKNKSFLCLGFDPEVESFPAFILDQSGSAYEAITTMYSYALEGIGSQVATVKPNIAFFERYGLEGLRAFVSVCSMIKDYGLTTIVDAKRGDIGNTARCYARAYFGSRSPGRYETPLVVADALTVNPFLGFDTIEVFLQAAEEMGKGIFVLVKTSNPGSSDIQDRIDIATGRAISSLLADWLVTHSGRLKGGGRFSGLGAVVGATHPERAQELRSIMPDNLFLMPGVGAQGGSVQEALSGFSRDSDGKLGGALIQVSRGLFSGLKAENKEQLISELKGRVEGFQVSQEGLLV